MNQPLNNIPAAIIQEKVVMNAVNKLQWLPVITKGIFYLQKPLRIPHPRLRAALIFQEVW